MTEKNYSQRRAELVSQFNTMLSLRLWMSARARIRKIADLDYEHRGIDREVTKEMFNYKKLNK